MGENFTSNDIDNPEYVLIDMTFGLAHVYIVINLILCSIEGTIGFC